MVFGLDARASADRSTRPFLDLLATQMSGGVARVAMTLNRTMLATLGLTAPAAIFLKDLEGRYAFANANTCEMLGRLDVIGRTDAELLGPETAERFAAQDRAVIAGNGSGQFEEWIGDRHYLLIKFPWPNPDGGLTGLYGVAIDISARKNIEETLRNSERQYRAIGESIDYGVWVCDANGRNVYASDSFLKLTGLTQEQCSDFGWVGALHPDDVDATLAAWQACVKSGELWDREHRIRGIDGEYHHVLARWVPVRDTNGAIVSWAGINLDISDIKEAEAALREADRRKDEFLSLLAHELRNPLAPIRSSLEAMNLRGFRDDVQRHTHDVISRQVASLVRMVDDLLDVARITHGKLSLQIESVEVARVIEEAIETARPYIEEMGHSLDVFAPTEPVVINADPVRLTQVIGNLLSNSAKYTPSGGRIELRATVSDDGVEIAVTDNGVGIAPDLQQSVFELFSQHHVRGGVGSASGLGIGLALVRDLMDMHGGSVRAHSDGVGRGSTFTIALPASAIAARPRGARPARPAHNEIARRRVLVVDDNVDAAESMAALLHLLGHEAQIANDGLAAVERTQRFEPDLILMDLGMPGMDGMQATMRIRALPLRNQPTIAAVTGWNQEASRTEARNAGIDLHVVKPIDVPGLQRILRAVGTRANATR
jgi:PAS domain S-box-containing protein